MNLFTFPSHVNCSLFNPRRDENLIRSPSTTPFSDDDEDDDISPQSSPAEKGH
jgi:hypothetical protein